MLWKPLFPLVQGKLCSLIHVTLQVVGGGMIATIGSSILCMSLPYEAGLNGKHLAWAGKFYSIKVKTPNSFTKLAADFKLSYPQELFSIPYRIASETYVCMYVWSCQYRILNFILFTSNKLFKIGLSDSFCGTYGDDLYTSSLTAPLHGYSGQNRFIV